MFIKTVISSGTQKCRACNTRMVKGSRHIYVHKYPMAFRLCEVHVGVLSNALLTFLTPASKLAENAERFTKVELE